MRYNYPISSQEIKDSIDQIYEMQLHILGYQDTSGLITYSGVYDHITTSGITIFTSGYNHFESLQNNPSKLDYIIDNIYAD